MTSAPSAPSDVRPPLVLTGGPGAGKTTCGRRLAETRPRCAFIDTDDLRQLVVAGAAAPWDGPEGERQRELGARNAVALSTGFIAAGVEAVVADVLSPASVRIWREAVPGAVVVRLVLGPDAALQRLGGRHRFITEQELRWTFAGEAAEPLGADLDLPVDGLTRDAQFARIEEAWARLSGECGADLRTGPPGHSRRRGAWWRQEASTSSATSVQSTSSRSMPSQPRGPR